MINIIVIRDGVVYTNYLYDNNVEAEEHFKILCCRYVADWQNLSEEDIDDILDCGYIEVNNGSICISHPIVVSAKLNDIND